MADVPATNLDPASPATAPQAAAHFETLHKMSTTAGVTNQGYVAVNHTAVAAFLLGLFSALALIEPLLLVIPVVGIAFALTARKQIRESSGTQTGSGMAILGLALCVLLGGGEIAKEVVAYTSVRGDETQIADALTQLGTLVKDNKYADAYKLFDDDFQDRVKYPRFQAIWDGIQKSPAVGRVEWIQWNGVRPEFNSAAGSPLAAVKARIKFNKPTGDERYDVVLRKVGGRWLIWRFPFFPDEKAKPGDAFNF